LKIIIRIYCRCYNNTHLHECLNLLRNQLSMQEYKSCNVI
jgi:hypothetical protein